MSDISERCSWANGDALYEHYHDTEWGIPDYDSRSLWEKLILEGFQAGLSWITILRKRENFRTAFAGFDPDIIATWGEGEVMHLLKNEGIIRHQGKIRATFSNARAFQEIEAQEGFSQFVWRHVAHQPVINHWTALHEVPAQTKTSQLLSKNLKKAGFKFCGPTIAYAFMQASGLVNDHLLNCPHRKTE